MSDNRKHDDEKKGGQHDKQAPSRQTPNNPGEDKNRQDKEQNRDKK